MKTVTYRDGSNYRYQLAVDYEIKIKPLTNCNVKTPDTHHFISLTKDGDLTIKAGYAWDGASGPAVNTKNFVRGSLVHDALYQLMRAGKVNRSKHRGYADNLLREICQEDGMSRFRSWYVLKAVKTFGGPSAEPGTGRERALYVAP